LSQAALLVHPTRNAKLRLVTDASDTDIGAALEQKIRNSSWQPHAFFSRKFYPQQIRYSAYDRELTAIFESIIYFRHILETSEFEIYTDHKPITFAFKQRLDKASPRQIRQLDFISQYSTNIIHISGWDNVIADALSRVDAIRMPIEFDLTEFSEQQKNDEEIPITTERLKPAHLEQVFLNLQQNLKSGHGNVPNKNDSGDTAT